MSRMAAPNSGHDDCYHAGAGERNRQCEAGGFPRFPRISRGKRAYAVHREDACPKTCLTCPQKPLPHCPRLDTSGGHVVGLKMRCACLALSDAAWACGGRQGGRQPSGLWASCGRHSRAARKARRNRKAAAERQLRSGFGMVVLTLTRGPRVRHGKGGVKVKRGSSRPGACQER